MPAPDDDAAATTTAPAIPRPDRSLVIWFTPRTGSTVLAAMLGESGTCGRPGEWFNVPDQRPSLRSHYDVADYAALQQAVWRRGSVGGVMAVKYSLYRALHEPISRELATLRNLDPDDSAELRWDTWADLLPNARHVYLARRNRLRQAASWWRAIQTGEWHRPITDNAANAANAADTADPPPAASYDRDALVHLLTEIALREAATQAFFSENGIAPLTLIYEDFVADLPGTAARIQAHLHDIAAPPLHQQPTAVPPPAYRRIADDTTEAWVQRLRADLNQDPNRPIW